MVSKIHHGKKFSEGKKAVAGKWGEIRKGSKECLASRKKILFLGKKKNFKTFFFCHIFRLLFFSVEFSFLLMRTMKAKNFFLKQFQISCGLFTEFIQYQNWRKKELKNWLWKFISISFRPKSNIMKWFSLLNMT